MVAVRRKITRKRPIYLGKSKTRKYSNKSKKSRTRSRKSRTRKSRTRKSKRGGVLDLAKMRANQERHHYYQTKYPINIIMYLMKQGKSKEDLERFITEHKGAPEFINEMDPGGFTPLEYAFYLSSIPYMTVLLDNGAEITPELLSRAKMTASAAGGGGSLEDPGLERRAAKFLVERAESV